MSKIFVDREKLKEAVEFVKCMVPQNPILAADGNIQVNFENGILYLVASDNGMQGAKAHVPVIGVEDDSISFSVGVEPQRLHKVVAKDVELEVSLEVKDAHLVVASKVGSDFATLALANMRRFSPLLAWEPLDPHTDIQLDHSFFYETVSFLGDFLPDTKDLGAKHAVVVLSNKVAHATNGINLRGICASPHLNFNQDVSLQKRFLSSAVRALKFMSSPEITFKANQRLVSISSSDGSRTVAMPTRNKKPPVVPLEYLKSMGESFSLDIKEAVKALDRMTSSNYNSATTLTGVDLTLGGDSDSGTLKLVLEDDKATKTFAVERQGSGDIEKTLDLKTFYKMMKMFQKSPATQLFMGDENSRFIRFLDKRSYNGVGGAFIAVSAYAKKV